MAGAALPHLLDRAAWHLVLRRWRRAARSGDRATLEALDRQGADLQAQMDAVAVRRQRLRAAQAGTPALPDAPALPPRTDWTWRPAPWARAVRPPGAAGAAAGTAIAPGLSLHHDCPLRTITWRQVPGTRAREWAQDRAQEWHVTLDWLGFAGSYVSVVANLPEAGRTGLDGRHVVVLQADLRAEQGSDCLVRLNIRHGPNLTRARLPLALNAGAQRAEFDLAYLRFDAARVTDVWIDVILGGHAANRVVLADLMILRHRRAEP